METALSFLFWAMKSETKGYSRGSCCPWPRKSFSYRGPCSHNALTEGIHGNFDLTGEQLGAITAETKERQRTYHQRQLAADPEGVREYRRDNGRRWARENPEKAKAKEDRRVKKAKAVEKYFCATCELACSKPSVLARHNLAERHINNVRKAAAGVVKRYRCNICRYNCDRPVTLRVHSLTERHIKKTAEAKSNSRST
jgi:hypothetical protein